MDARRKTLGRRIQKARRAAGYKSAKAFAAAMGISESSVANAESGKETVGSGVYMDIETELGWPDGCSAQFLETGDESLLPIAQGNAGAAAPRYPPDLQDDTERELWDMVKKNKGAEEDAWYLILNWRTRRDAKLRAQERTPLHEPGSSTQTEQFGS